MQGWFQRLIAAPDSPTADLYFCNAGASGFPGIARLGPTTFASDEAVLVVRHAARSAPLPRRRRLIYLVDDDVPAGLIDASLPRLYRRKLALLEAPCWRRMLREADLILATSATLADRLESESDAKVSQISPFWPDPFPPLDHHSEDGAINIAFLGSSVHRADLQFLLPVIERMLKVEPRVRFHLASRHLLPSWLSRHPRVRRLPGRGWTGYRRGMRGRRFHLALYPLLDTPFNRARSVNKMIEHALFGAAAIYSASWPESRRVADGVEGCVLPNDRAAWEEAILALLEDEPARQRLAVGAQNLASRLNAAEPQRRLWRDAMGVAA